MLIIPAVVCIAVIIAVVLSLTNKPWTAKELDVINQPDSVMQVMVMPADSAVLRAISRDVDRRAYTSKELQTLLAKMLCTVTDPSQDGVGIAAPQVGINRRIVCVQRFDKPDEPWGCYVNIKIDSLYGPVTPGAEGCLSVPGLRGVVPRYQSVDISYVNLENGEKCKESVHGFTAVIFQHECDHLDGILYTDRATSVQHYVETTR